MVATIPPQVLSAVDLNSDQKVVYAMLCEREFNGVSVLHTTGIQEILNLKTRRQAQRIMQTLTKLQYIQRTYAYYPHPILKREEFTSVRVLRFLPDGTENPLFKKISKTKN